MCVVGQQRLDRRLARNSKATKREPRDRQRSLRVVVSARERAQIEERARIAGLSVTAYLRRRNTSPDPFGSRPSGDLRSGEGQRLGSLVKLWLTERAGQGAPAAEVRCLLNNRRRTVQRNQGGGAGFPPGAGGSAKATTASPNLVRSFELPPAAMTTNCRPPAT